MTVINWVNTWLSKDGQSDIATNEIIQDEQDGWVHLDVNPEVTLIEDDSIHPSGDSIVNVVSVGVPPESSDFANDLSSTSISAKMDDPVEDDKPNLNTEKLTRKPAGETETSRIGDKTTIHADSEKPARELSRQERRYLERKIKKSIARNRKAATTEQRNTKPQQNCVSVARSVSMI